MSNQGNQSRYGKLYTADKKGNELSFVGFIDVSVRKECPNCFVFFIKNDNLHCMHETLETLSADSTFVQHADAK